jgi:hypothetical protein
MPEDGAYWQPTASDERAEDRPMAPPRTQPSLTPPRVAARFEHGDNALARLLAHL